MSDTTHSEWTDGDFTLDAELGLVIRYQEIREKLYYQVYLKGDADGSCNVEPYLSNDERKHIEACIIDALEENENE